MSTQTRIIAIPSLAALIDELSDILESPIQRNVASSEAQASVLGNVRAAFINQDQLPIPSDSSAGRGAFVALRSAAENISLLSATVEGDHLPADTVKLNRDRDDRGRLNPIRLFEEDVEIGIFPFVSIALALRETTDPDALRFVLQQDALALVFVEDADDWDTWMDTFAR